MMPMFENQPTREEVLDDLASEIQRADKFLTHSPSGDLDRRFVVAPEGGGRAIREVPHCPGRYSLISFRTFGPWTPFEFTDAVVLRATLNAAVKADEPRFNVLSVREALEAHREACTLAIAALKQGAAA